jgi:hypothetical protein
MYAAAASVPTTRKAIAIREERGGFFVRGGMGET